MSRAQSARLVWLEFVVLLTLHEGRVRRGPQLHAAVDADNHTQRPHQTRQEGSKPARASARRSGRMTACLPACLSPEFGVHGGCCSCECRRHIDALGHRWQVGGGQLHVVQALIEDHTTHHHRQVSRQGSRPRCDVLRGSLGSCLECLEVPEGQQVHGPQRPLLPKPHLHQTPPTQQPQTQGPARVRPRLYLVCVPVVSWSVVPTCAV